ncbi:MAG: flagellar basal body L-ring protein FlgH, partial [Aeromonas veronii]
GDIITIELSESTSASKKANTQSGKDNKFNLDPVKLGGVPVTASPYDLSASIGQNSAFKGQAKADQSNSLQGNISVSVAKVLPNGNLVVRGEKWIMLNNGNEYIRITGLIRPEDVTSDNSVSSQKVANARIYYGGTGDLANSQEQGWLTSFFNGPWWPL